MKYAVLEWKNDGINDDYADVIALNQSLDIAKGLVLITPPHLHREYISMSEYEVIKKG